MALWAVTATKEQCQGAKRNHI